MSTDRDISSKRGSDVREFLAASEARGISRAGRVFPFPIDGVNVEVRDQYPGGSLEFGSDGRLMEVPRIEHKISVTPYSRSRRSFIEWATEGPTIREQRDQRLSELAIDMGPAENGQMQEMVESMRLNGYDFPGRTARPFSFVPREPVIPVEVLPVDSILEPEPVAERSVEREAKRSTTAVIAEAARNWTRRVRNWRRRNERESGTNIETSANRAYPYVSYPAARYPQIDPGVSNILTRNSSFEQKVNKYGCAAVAFVGVAMLGLIANSAVQIWQNNTRGNAENARPSTGGDALDAINPRIAKPELSGGAGNSSLPNNPDVTPERSRIPAREVYVGRERKVTVNIPELGRKEVSLPIVSANDGDIFKQPRRIDVPVVSGPAAPESRIPVEVPVIPVPRVDDSLAKVIERYLTSDNLKKLKEYPRTNLVFDEVGSDDELLNPGFASLEGRTQGEAAKAEKEIRTTAQYPEGPVFDQRLGKDHLLAKGLTGATRYTQTRDLVIAGLLVDAIDNPGLISQVVGFMIQGDKIVDVIFRANDPKATSIVDPREAYKLWDK